MPVHDQGMTVRNCRRKVDQCSNAGATKAISSADLFE